jgi:hypothetical protein
MIAAIGFVAAPALFATLPRADAGRTAGRLFALDAAIGLAFGTLLLVLALQEARVRAESGRGSRFSGDMALALAALFCIVAGHYASEPMLAAAQRGEGPAFAVVHGVSTAFFVVKFLAVAALAWRLTRRPGRATERG